jgi:WD40 repeat protein
MRAIGFFWIFVFICSCFPVSAQAFEQKWTVRHDIDDLGSFSFDAAGQLRTVGSELRFFSDQDGRPERPALQGVEGLQSASDDRRKMARLIANGEFGEGRRYRLFVSEIGAGMPLFDSEELALGDMPKIRSSRNGRYHLIVPDTHSGAYVDPDTYLIDVETGETTRFFLPKGIEPLVVSNGGNAYILGSEGLLVYDLTGRRQGLIATPGADSTAAWVYAPEWVLSTDERRLAVATTNTETFADIVRIYDLEARVIERDLPLSFGSQERVAAIGFLPDGVRVAIAGYEEKASRRIMVYDLREGVEPELLWDHESLAQYAFPELSPDGTRLAVVKSDGSVDFYDRSAGQSAAPAKRDLAPPELVAGLGGLATLTDIAISPDNSLLATADYQGQLWLWDLASGRAIRQFGTYDDARMAFAADGTQLEVLGGDSILAFDLKSGKALKRLEVDDYPPLLFRPLGESRGYLVCNMRGCLYRPGEAERGATRLDVPEHANKVAACENRLFFVTNGKDGTRLDIAAFDASEPQLTRVIHSTRLELDKVSSIACGPKDSGFLGTETGHLVHFSQDGAVLAEADPGSGKIRAIEPLLDGRLLVGVDGASGFSGAVPARLAVLKEDGLRLDFAVSVPLPAGGAGGYLLQLGVSDDRRRMVSVTDANDLVLDGGPVHVVDWNLEALLSAGPSAENETLESEDFVLKTGLASGGLKPQGLTFSPDGRKLAVTLGVQTALWDMQTGQVLKEQIHGYGQGLTFDGDGYFYLENGADPAQAGLVHARYDGSTVRRPLPDRPAASIFSIMLTGGDLLTAGSTLALGADEGTVIWLKETGMDGPPASYLLPAPGTYHMGWRSLDPGGNRLLIQTMDGLLLQDVHNRNDPVLWEKTALPDGMEIDAVENAAFMPDGQHVLVPLEDYSSDYGFVALDADSGEIKRRWEKGLTRIDLITVRISHPGNGPELHGLLKLDGLGFGEFLMAPEESDPPRIDLQGLQPVSATASPDGRLLAIRGLGNETLVWDRAIGVSRILDVRLSDAVAPAYSVAFAPDGSLVAILDTSGAVKLFDVKSGRLLGRLLSFSGGGWAVAGADGRYDASDPGNIGRLSWIVADEPLYPVPVEAFIQEYYEPRLLARRIAGEDFAPLPLPQDKNRVTPEIERIDVDPPMKRSDATPTVTVRVAVAEATRGGITSGLGAVKLFRDGQLVALAEEPQFDKDRRTELAFEGIALPPDQDAVIFSAYAFNSDGIKGVSATREYDVPRTLAADPARRAFVIAVGVNTYDNPAWNLAYAAFDAEATAKILKDRLEASGAFREVYSVPLLSRGSGPSAEPRLARRDVIEAVIGQLAGRPLNVALPENLRAQVPTLPKARPQDLVYLAFAGHGLAGSDGRFHFFPQEFGAGSKERKLTGELIAASLDSDRLTELLRDIDAHDMVLVIDACNSAASVEGKGFKPGPMGSKGLGQLAYDKSMRVLAASQAEAMALESDLLRHGALTYALLVEGLEAGHADRAPVDGLISLKELLGYSRDRVPELYLSLRTGLFKPLGRGSFSLFEEEEKPNIPAQQPALFDFRRSGRQDVVMTAPD